jgi:ubiquinone/menaquinone biosynthesis C-methylase UbiE
MTSPAAERFNRTADGYLKWWAPILAPASVALVDRVTEMDPGLPAGETREVADVGCGTGSSLFEAAGRWRGARLTGLDASVGMLDVARREATRLPAAVRTRIGYGECDAAALPLADASLDVLLTAFMLQQLPTRAPALAEFRRVLRPGGVVGIAGWLVDAEPFAPDLEFEAALADAGLARQPRDEPRSGHFETAAAAAQELSEAGFVEVTAVPFALDKTWTRADYATYRETTRDFDLFDELAPTARRRAHGAFARRLAALSDDRLAFRPPVLTIVGRRP